MKKNLLSVFMVLFFVQSKIDAQITTPVIRARYGVDGELRANYFGGAVQASNDDWFNLPTGVLSTDTTGKSVIDITGAAAILAGYNSDVSPWPRRMASFYKTMSRPPFSIVNNRLWLDAIFVRDYHGNDTSVFTSGSDKNGMSPANWTGGIQGIPDKNDILDMMVHVRRAGPNMTDSLWMFGGISLDNTTGNRYFDFEMYQTDIYYDRPSGKFYGYGADAGHTSWTFDASGNIVRPGDIIFSGEFQSGTLTKIEARIWVKRTDWQTLTPTSFNWSGLFDGASAGSVYGYASISPKVAGTFYTGLGSANNSWAGPFGLVLQDNSLAISGGGPATTTNSKYTADQFIEFSVNLTKLGLDPVTLLGGDVCATPFNRVVVKTRASASFTAELKDFVAPTDLFLAPRAQIQTITPYICDTGSIANIYVSNPVATSTYIWSTPNGHIVGSTTGPSINVDTPGTYIVRQYLQVGCSLYADDTLAILQFNNCEILNENLIDFRGSLNNQLTHLNWTVLHNEGINSFAIEYSLDRNNFELLNTVNPYEEMTGTAYYSTTHDISGIHTGIIYYRLRLAGKNGKTIYSNIITMRLSAVIKAGLLIYPNPSAAEQVFASVQSARTTMGEYVITDMGSKIISRKKILLYAGNNTITLSELGNEQPGAYFIKMIVDGNTFIQKIIVSK